MLSVFPELLTYGLLAPLILRLVAGIFFLKTGMTAFYELKQSSFPWTEILKQRKSLEKLLRGTVEAVGGLLLCIGFLTQVAALVLALVAAERFIHPYYKEEKKVFPIAEALLIAILISLMITGPGFFAIDLPL